MKKFLMLGLALCAVASFGAVAVTPAFAADEFLVNAAPVPGTGVFSQTEFAIELTTFSAGAVLDIVLCSGFYDNLLFPTLMLVEDILNLANEEIGALGDLNELPLLCEVTFDAGAATDCKVGANEAEVWPLNISLELTLTWDRNLLLVGTGFVLDFPPAAGWEWDCKDLLGVTTENACEGGEESAAVTNSSEGTLLEEFTELEESKRENCTGTGEHSAEILGKEVSWASETEGGPRQTTAAS